MSSVEYRAIPGYPDYRIGSDGSLWSTSYKRPLNTTKHDGCWRSIAPALDKDGYRKVILYHKGQRRYVRLHMLVLEVFVGPKPTGMGGAHCNGKKEDNRVTNLRWDTQRNNIADKHKHGTLLRGSRHHAAKLTEDDVRTIRAMYRPRTRGRGAHCIARTLGLPRQAVAMVTLGQTWRHVK